MEANSQIEKLDNLLVVVEQSPDKNNLNELFRCIHTLKGGFGFCGMEVCTRLVHAAEDLLDILRHNPTSKIPSVWMDILFNVLDTVRVICIALENAVDDTGSVQFEIPLTEGHFTALQSDLRLASSGVTDQERFKSLKKTNTSADDTHDFGTPTVLLELKKIDEVVDLVGELVISQSALRKHFASHMDIQTDGAFTQCEKILTALQRRSMKLRMLPLQKEFGKFPRIIRNLARDLNKDIDFSILGGETEIDKSVLDAMHGPLVHLVRNAIDHGIEPPDDRERKGKPRRGKLSLSAFHESGHVYVEVNDDGKGLNREKIIERALKLGLVQNANELSREETDRLIFHPGFSTADEITNVSGRGVGMDVVLREIEKMRGKIFIDSNPGQGTKVTIELPLTVAIISGLIARMGNIKIIFPVNQVVEAINPAPEQIQGIQGNGQALLFREHVIPVIVPGLFMPSVNCLESDSTNQRSVMVIVRTYQGEFAIRINELISHEQVVIKQLTGSEVEESDLFSGAAILGDGAVGLILNIDGLIREFEKRTGKELSVEN